MRGVPYYQRRLALSCDGNCLLNGRFVGLKGNFLESERCSILRCSSVIDCFTGCWG